MKRFYPTILVAAACLCCLPDGASGLAPPLMVDHSSQLLASATSAVPLLGAYLHTLAAHPLPTKMATGAALAVTGDSIAQAHEPHEFDKQRAMSFAAFDMCYRALQHVAFPVIVAHCHGQYISAAVAALAPSAASAVPLDFAAAMEQTLASQLGIVPFLYYPVFFAMTAAVQQLSVERAIDRAKQTFWPLFQRNLLFWIPIQFIQFSFIEESLQIPFLSACGLCWTFILSVMAGSTKEFKEEEPYCVTGLEGECILPDDLFPHATLEEIGNELTHEVEVVGHTIEVIGHDVITVFETNGKEEETVEMKEEMEKEDEMAKEEELTLK